MRYKHKFLSIFILAALLALTLVTPARAFDGRSGDRVVIESDEVVNDDLYVGAEEFVLDGTVHGDVIVFARNVTINGEVDGDLIAAAQTVAVNGEVTGAVRIAGSVLLVGTNGTIGEDVLGAGYSFEGRDGSAIGRDLVFAGGQILLASDVARNVQVATGAFELSGDVGGDVKAEVADASERRVGPPPTVFMPQTPVPIPTVKPGLTIEPSASIAGDLEYTQSQDLTLPAGVVTGEVIRRAPERSERTAVQEETSADKVSEWLFDSLRTALTLILIGLLLLWLFPSFMLGLSEKLRTRPWPSLGWGAFAWVVFFVALFVILAFMVIGGLVFGLLTLGQLSGTVIWVGLLTLLALITGFVLVTSFVAKIVFGTALGKWIFQRINPSLAEHRYWPMLLGILITLAVIALFSFPLIPGFLGWLLNFTVILFGLGALWLWGRERLQQRTV
jgi:hypothetical protein